MNTQSTTSVCFEISEVLHQHLNEYIERNPDLDWDTVAEVALATWLLPQLVREGKPWAPDRVDYEDGVKVAWTRYMKP